MTAGASLHRHVSKQDVETPADFLQAVTTRFGRPTADLACTIENAKAPDAFVEGDARPWPREGLLWLNPPFGDIAPWAARCAAWRPLVGHSTALASIVGGGSDLREA